MSNTNKYIDKIEGGNKVFCEKGETMQQMLKRADRSMSQHKKDIDRYYGSNVVTKNQN